MSNFARTFGQDLMRGEHLLGKGGGGMTAEAQDPAATGTSIFDPVLCELAYRWFSPPGGTVIDPFAGGSVRGIVAGKLGRRYVGVELRAEQVAENRRQGERLFAALDPQAQSQPQAAPVAHITDPNQLTPVERRGTYWFKRDDLFDINGANGGKARATLQLAKGAAGLVSISARTSPQNARAARIAQHLGIPARCHTGIGEATPLTDAVQAAGGELVRHNPPRLSVLKARAQADADERAGWAFIPFGAVSQTTVDLVRVQVQNLPREARRIVVPVGSGTTLAGVLHGLRDLGWTVPVVGVSVGGDPTKTLDALAPEDWRERVQLVKSDQPFEEPARCAVIEGLELDATYEGKLLPFLQPEDVVWLVGAPITAPSAEAAASGALSLSLAPVQVAPEWRVGDSRNIETLCADVEADFLFSCPPYADLEVYSDDPADLSTLDYDAFKAAYREIIAKACARLRQDRFACFVVGDVRDRRGHYYNFVGDTVEAFRAAGLHYYNEAILVTAVGSLPIRAGRQFAAGRKLGKTHQNVLVFVKGDGKRAADACGTVDVSLPLLDGGSESGDEGGLTGEL